MGHTSDIQLLKVGQIVMILRSTLVLLTSFTALTLTAEGATAALLTEPMEKRTQQIFLAQAEPPASAYPVNPAVDPSGATNTDNTVPNVTNPGGNTNSQAAPAGNGAANPSQVRVLQQQLQQRGYYNGPVDGVYGTDTQRAVQSFQQDSGFSSTGQLNPATEQRLNTPNLNEAGQTDEPTVQAIPGTPVNPTFVNPDNNQTNGQSAQAGGSQEAANSTPGTEESEVNTEAELEDAQARLEAASQVSSGIGRLLWPGLALVAALGSFGVGFMLANRGKGEESAEEDDAWGTVSPDLNIPQNHNVPRASASTTVKQVDSEVQTPTLANNGTNGTATIPNNASAAPAEMVANTFTPTTKLTKVNIVDELIGDLQVPDPQKRRRAIWELGQRGNSSAVQSLVNAMVDADSKEKSLILASLSEIGIRSLKPMNRALAIALQDDNPDVRKNAIRDLTRIYDLVTQISQMLGHATEDEDAEVRQTANWALEQLNRIRQVPGNKTALPPIESPRQKTDLLSGDRSN